MKQRPRILLADDHRIVAEGLRGLLEENFELAGIVEDGRALLEMADTLRPDIIVADITMPHLNGLDALPALRKKHPDTKVVFLTQHQDAAYARRALEGGASGFVVKHAAPEELVMAIRSALAGDTFVSPALAGKVLQSIRRNPDAAEDPVAALTPRQRQVLQLLVEGKSAKEVAADLGISTRTVEFHKYQMMDALEIRTSAELVHFAVKHGLVAT